MRADNFWYRESKRHGTSPEHRQYGPVPAHTFVYHRLFQHHGRGGGGGSTTTTAPTMASE